jgi:hypothetical protein
MATYDDAHHITISGDEARTGVTGHNVRYVLAFGMTGVIAAFAAIAIYFGFDTLQERASAALAQSPYEVLHAFAAYAAVALVGAIAAGLVLGIWNMISGRSESDSQTLMRLRVAVQFALICVIMVMLAHVIG